jgi:hypothetical protein
MTLSTTVDMDGNGQNEASLTSAFDESGNLRSNSYTMDTSGDGVADYGEAYTYDRSGNETGHVVIEDTDHNGSMDKQTHTRDTDGNGKMDTQTTMTSAEDGSYTRSVARDDNEDGVMDWAFNESFDAEGNRTSYGNTIFEDGMYGSGSGHCGCPGEPEPVPEPVVPAPPPPVDEPVDVISPPSAGGTSPVDETAPANATMAAEFVSEDAGYSNALYTYDVDDQGNVSNIRQVIDDSNSMTGGAALGDVSTTDGKPNLLLLPNGADAVDENSELTIVDGKLQVDGQPYEGDAYFSHSAEMSTDGKQHFQMSTDADGNTIVNMEDLRDLGDNDFNDLTIKLTPSSTPPSSGGQSPVNDGDALATMATDFADYDTDGSGFLSKQELQAIVNGGGPLAATAQTLLDNYNGAIFGNIDPTNEAWAGMSANDLNKLGERVNAGTDLKTAIWDAAIDIGKQRGVVTDEMTRDEAVQAMNAYVESTQSRLGVQDDVAPPSAGGTSSPEQPEPKPVITGEVEIFEHSNYNGKKSTLGLGYYSYNDIKAMGLNDKTSSLKVPEGMVVVAYEHADKRGEQFVYKSDTNWVGGGANDKFSSFEVMTEQEYAARQSKTVDLFEHANYKGDVASFTLEGDYQFINYDQIKAMSMNDKTSSLKVPEGMVVVAYEHANRGGNKSVYTADSGWVGSGVNDKFSSLELMTQAEYDKRYGSSVEVFEHAAYAGQSATLSASFYDIQAIKNLGLHDKISSIKVPEDMVLVTWEHGNKGGARNVYREGDTAFVGGSNNDNISNMEVMTEAEYLERINNGGF